MKYDFKKIEKKWQKKWEQEKVFEVEVEKRKKKYTIIEMFPYPSGEGLHMGHALNYTIGDVFARFKRMKGFNVFYPMGFDSFGLPAENAAIKVKEHPKKYTQRAINNYIKQQKALGLSYDWSKILSTSEPEYYKWNQFWFLKFLEKGLVYRKKSFVNWCSKCKTVLANEQVQGGRCWRHEDTEVEIKQLEQWFIKTTAYADELLDCIDNLKWPDKIKTMQKNWIGKSHGIEIDFEVENSDKTTISNVVIVHGCPGDEEKAMNPKTRTYDKHWIPWIKNKLEKKEIKVFTPLMPEPWKANYSQWKKEFDKLNVNGKSVLIGHSCGCAFLVRWLGETKKKIKKLILVAPWKIAQSGNAEEEFYNYEIDESIKSRIDEIVIFTSNDEEEDGKKSVKIFNKLIGGEIIELKNHGHFTLGDMGTEEFPELLSKIVGNKSWPIFTTRPDTLFGVTFMVVSAQHPNLMELVTDNQKKDVEKFLKKIKSVSAKEMENLEKIGVFTGSYAINPVTKNKVPIYSGNFVVADYGSGMVMAVPAHDQRDFEFAKKYGIEIKQVINCEEINKKAHIGKGKLINSDKFNGLDNEKAKQEITNFLIKNKLGRKKVQYKLKDWLVSRQRYWGTPIPVVYCDKCGIVPVPEKNLPIVLPDKVKFGKGNPLETNKAFVSVKCPICRGNAKRETDTMDTFFDSSWYYLRYSDNKNRNLAFDKKKVEYWLPVDQYIGGAEHACMHLIYARFFTKALRDLGFLKFDEPFLKLFNQGMLHGPDGEKMSKSKGNIINPDEVSEKYGMDSARFFLLALALPDKSRDWSEEGIQGSSKFLKKILDYFNNVKIGKSNVKIESKLNKIIKEVTTQIENFKYNLAIIKIRDLFNSLSSEESKDVLEKSLKLLHPFCPHITEELWEKIKGKGFISLSRWPEADEKKIDENLDKQEELIKKLKSDIEKIKKLTGHHRRTPRARNALQGAKKNPKIYVYVLPNELKTYQEVEEINLYAVNDKNKYDPENKSKKVKPNRPGIYLE
ncbi:MAG: leucine--tRNA ligase [Nanoarchaeota archaeon]|nr:leucine--tRNA ligase [Nanoarchaeota archaeon]MBU4116512.1 leucine--tRNA ligase [Nanoarchaeota archaeon]